jgi:probable F420-dependent oxidoreductase
MTVDMTAAELRQRLRRVGIWMPPPERTGIDPAKTAAAIEGAGFTSVWVGGGNAAPDAFERLRPMLAGSSRLIVATGIANVWAWEPGELRAAAEALAADFPGRFILGLGVSHAPAVAALGHSYERPLRKMEKFLDELDHPAFHGADRDLPPVVLAALGPKMLELCRDQALGAHPYFTPPEHTAFARSVLGTMPLLVPEQAVTLSAEAAPGARAYAERYLRLPNYTRNLERFGFTPADLTGGGSDRLISAIIPSGPRAAGAAIRAHLDAGADHVVIQPLDASGGFAPAALGDLASVVTGLMSLHRPERPVLSPAPDASQPGEYRRPVTSYRWCTGSWMKYRPNVSMVNAAPSLRRPVRRHWSWPTPANRVASGSAAAPSCRATSAGSCSPYRSAVAVSSWSQFGNSGSSSVSISPSR